MLNLSVRDVRECTKKWKNSRTNMFKKYLWINKQTYLVRYKIAKAVQSKDTQQPDDHVFYPFLMLP